MRYLRWQIRFYTENKSKQQRTFFLVSNWTVLGGGSDYINQVSEIEETDETVSFLIPGNQLMWATEEHNSTENKEGGRALHVLPVLFFLLLLRSLTLLHMLFRVTRAMSKVMVKLRRYHSLGNQRKGQRKEEEVCWTEWLQTLTDYTAASHDVWHWCSIKLSSLSCFVSYEVVRRHCQLK